MLPLEIAGRAVDSAWLDELVEVLGIGARLRHRPAQLSGGEQQRVAVARALVSRPDVNFADEPTGTWDPRTGHELLSLVAEAVIATGDGGDGHPRPRGGRLSRDRVVFLVDGRVADDLADPLRRRSTKGCRPCGADPTRERSVRPAPVGGSGPRPGPRPGRRSG